jgi:hypothetical protein
MDPHPEQDEQPEARTDRRGGVVAAVVIGGILLTIVVLHIAGAMSLHNP